MHICKGFLKIWFYRFITVSIETVLNRNSSKYRVKLQLDRSPFTLVCFALEYLHGMFFFGNYCLNQINIGHPQNSADAINIHILNWWALVPYKYNYINLLIWHWLFTQPTAVFYNFSIGLKVSRETEKETIPKIYNFV